MEKQEKHIYEFDILEKDIVNLEKGEFCDLFTDRIQGSNACMNCTYNKAITISDKKLRCCKCVKSYYSDKHHELTIDTIKKYNAIAKNQAKTEEQKLAERRKEVREFLIKNGLMK